MTTRALDIRETWVQGESYVEGEEVRQLGEMLRPR
jgi:hypothetical protein